MPRIPLALALALALLPVAAAEEKPARPIVSISGAHSAYAERAYFRATDAQALAEVWMRHLGKAVPERYDYFYNPARIPEVDFDRYMVVAIFQGSSVNSAGVKVEEVLEDEARVVIRFADRSYQTAGVDGGAEACRPYGFFVVPRTTKAVVLEENVQSYIGKPPIWRERIVFEARK
jgi:hypothetical protein